MRTETRDGQVVSFEWREMSEILKIKIRNSKHEIRNKYEVWRCCKKVYGYIFRSLEVSCRKTATSGCCSILREEWILVFIPFYS